MHPAFSVAILRSAVFYCTLYRLRAIPCNVILSRPLDLPTRKSEWIHNRPYDLVSHGSTFAGYVQLPPSPSIHHQIQARTRSRAGRPESECPFQRGSTTEAKNGNVLYIVNFVGRCAAATATISLSRRCMSLFDATFVVMIYRKSCYNIWFHIWIAISACQYPGFVLDTLRSMRALNFMSFFPSPRAHSGLVLFSDCIFSKNRLYCRATNTPSSARVARSLLRCRTWNEYRRTSS